MSECMVYMTVEIAVGDCDQPGFALGGLRPIAEKMQKALAAHLGVEEPPEGQLLTLTLTSAEVRSVLKWINANFPAADCLPLDKKPDSPLVAASAVPSAPPSPWRVFQLQVCDTVPVTDDLVPIVAAFVDVLHQEVTARGMDPMQRISAIRASYQQPVLRVTVVPRDRTVYVAQMSAEEAAQLPEVQPTPYTNGWVH